MRLLFYLLKITKTVFIFQMTGLILHEWQLFAQIFHDKHTLRLQDVNIPLDGTAAAGSGLLASFGGKKKNKY